MHNHRDKITSMSEKKPVERRHSHNGHILPSPASVIDQLKTKVRHRRLSKKNSLESSDSAAVLYLNATNSGSPRSSQDQVDRSSVRLVNNRSITPPILETIFSFDGNEQETTISMESNEALVFRPSAKNEDEKSLPPNDSNSTDANLKSSRRKSKALKGTKSLPEANTKKRRQTVRRTGFQIRDEDFHLIFSDLPADEQLVIGLPCAWRKEVFMHGRMFLSVNYLCFYTCFFKWEESVCIPYKDIISVTREKSAVVLPNAIKIRTKSDENYLFASVIPREKFFITIFRLWQNDLLEQPLDFQQLRTLIHADQPTIDESTGDSDESLNLENTSEFAAQSESLPTPTSLNEKSMIISNRRTVSLPDSEKMPYLPTCPCETHLAKTYAEKTLALNVDRLFELLFGDNSFTQDYHATHNLNDFNYGEWKLNKETGFRERLVTYKTTLQSVIGSNSLTCREKQTLKLEKPGSVYVLTSEVNNEGMKFTDKFSVITQFCMVQKDAEHSYLRASAELRYIKNVNSLIKTFIEKNAYSTIEEQVNEQVRRLEAQQTTSKSLQKQRSVPKQRSIDSPTPRSSQSLPSNLSIEDKSLTRKGLLHDLLILIGIVIFFLHIYLCYKLYSFDQRIQSPETLCLNQCREKCLLNYRQ